MISGAKMCRELSEWEARDELIRMSTPEKVRYIIELDSKHGIFTKQELEKVLSNFEKPLFVFAEGSGIDKGEMK